MATSIRTYGDKDKAERHWQMGQFFLDQMKHSNSFQNLKQGFVARTLPDGTQIVARSVMGTDWVDIISPAGGLGKKTTTRTSPEDLFIAYNIPERNGAWDIDAHEKMPVYRRDVPVEGWAAGESYYPNPPGMAEVDMPAFFTTSSLQGDPLIYWFNHADPGPHPERDTRINVLKSWTYNVKVAPEGDGFVGTDTVTIFHRKSISFLDQIRGSVFPYSNFGDTIEVYHSTRQSSGTPSKITRVYSNLWSTMNFYVAPNGDFTIVSLYGYGTGGSGFEYKLDSVTYNPVGVLQDSMTATSSNITVEPFAGFGPISIAYDGSDYYCTVNAGDIQGGHGGLPVFTESNVHVSATKLYDYDPVNRVIVSMDKVGHIVGDTVPTQWWLGVVSWYDFVRRRWYSMDMMFEGDAYSQEFILHDGVDQVFAQSDASAYSGGSITLTLNPKFWCRYDGGWDRGNPLREFPLPFYPWNIHYTVGGYQQLCTLETYTNNRPRFDQWIGFSQLSGTLPDLSTYNNIQHRKLDGSLSVASQIPGGEAKWTTNGVILNVEKVTTTTTVTEGVANG